MVSAWSKIAMAASLAASVTAQTYTSCNPMKKSCDPDVGLAASSYTVDFTKGADDDNWEGTGHGDVKYTSDGAEFTIDKEGQSPTIQTKWHMFFGRLEVHLKAAPGQGIVSSIVFLSDVLDEIDWEFLGGRPNEAQSNWYAKASTDNTQSLTFPVDNAQADFHNYTVHWTSESIEWYIDSTKVRTLAYPSGGVNYPQTPMRIKLGIWAGGDPTNAEGTIEWAGGETQYQDAPFTMTVQKVMVENLNPSDSYSYGDESGSYKSIKFDKKDNGSDDEDKDEDKDETESTTTTKAESKTSESATGTATDSSTATATDFDSDSTTMSTAKSTETGSSDFKNNKAEETNGSETGTSTGSSASSTAKSDQNSASGNMSKIWLSLSIAYVSILLI